MHLGEKIEGGKVLYYSNEEDMNVLLGIYGQSIDINTVIDISEVERKGNKIKILLFVEMNGYIENHENSAVKKDFNG